MELYYNRYNPYKPQTQTPEKTPSHFMNHKNIHPLVQRRFQPSAPMAQVGEVSIGELLTTVRGGFKIYKCYLQGSSPRKGPDHEVLLGLEKIGKLLGPFKRGTKTD